MNASGLQTRRLFHILFLDKDKSTNLFRDKSETGELEELVIYQRGSKVTANNIDLKRSLAMK